MSKAWELRKDEVLLGVLIAEQEAFPWYECRFEAAREFERYRALFEEEARLAGAQRDEAMQQQWDIYRQEMRDLGLQLMSFGKARSLNTFALHIRGERARVRVR